MAEWTEKDGRFTVAVAVEFLRRLELARAWPLIYNILGYAAGLAPEIWHDMDKDQLRAEFETLWRRDHGEV